MKSANPSTIGSGAAARITYREALLIGPPVLAALAGIGTSLGDEVFTALLVGNMWLLGYHHVIATYTRTMMDRTGWQRYWPLSVLLFPLVIAFVYALLQGGGIVLVTTIYIHWQLFHYIRQSEGIAKSLEQGAPSVFTNRALRALFYAFPAASFLTMCANAGDKFLGFDIWLPRLPVALLAVVWVVVAVLAAAVAIQIARTRVEGDSYGRVAPYLASHFGVFGLAYLAMGSIDKSWLVASCWHNLQYLLFVAKANRASVLAGKVSPSGLLAAIARPGRLGLYIAFCLTLTVLVYYSLMSVEPWVASTIGLSAVGASALIYQSMNFHHYIVDAIIWRRGRRRP